MIEEIDPEILKKLPRSFQIFYRYIAEVQQEAESKAKAQRKKKGGA